LKCRCLAACIKIAFENFCGGEIIASQPLPVIIYAGKRGSGVLPQNDSFSSINLISELSKKFGY